MPRLFIACFSLVLIISLGSVSPVKAQPAADMPQAVEVQPADPTPEALIDRGIAFLRETQAEDGSWTPDFGPAITALAITPMLDHPDIDHTDPAVAKAIEYILSFVQEDGSIHSGLLQNYNTSICVSALARVEGRPDIDLVVQNALAFLRTLQWHDQFDPDGNPVTQAHPWYGGAGYGSNGRPDMSNIQFMLQAFHDAGIHPDDPAFQRALVFLNRCQGTDANDMFSGEVVTRDGGFIYSTTVNSENIGTPESKANPEMIDEGRAGRPVSGLRSYGSITYAGFKSLLYADLNQADARVAAVLEWVRHNYSLEQNPGMPEALAHHGYFYYFMTFARGLNAFGQDIITDIEGVEHDWAAELTAKLAELQKPDGSWVNDADRWMEGDANLVTAYALIALTEARE